MLTVDSVEMFCLKTKARDVVPQNKDACLCCPSIFMLSFFIKLDRMNWDATTDLNHTMVTKEPDQQQHPHTQTHNENYSDLPPYPKINGFDSVQTPSPFPPLSNQVKKYNAGRRQEGDDDVGGPVPDNVARPNHHPNDGNYDPCETTPLYPPSRSQSRHRATQEHPQRDASPSNNSKEGQQENVVLRRGFVPRTAPERVAQRKSSMAQLQQWVNQRRGMASQEDLHR